MIRGGRGGIDRESPQGTFEIVPAPFGSASMTEVHALFAYVQFVFVVGFVVGGFVAEAAFSRDDVGGSYSKVVGG